MLIDENMNEKAKKLANVCIVFKREIEYHSELSETEEEDQIEACMKNVIAIALQEADAEGYRRGVEEPCGNCGVRKDDNGRTHGTGGGE